METARQQKVARIIQKELSNIFLLNKKHWNWEAMLTVTVVRVTADLSIARVYISVYGKEDKKAVIEMIKSQTAVIRGMLGNAVGKQLRIIPTLEFFLDDSLDYQERIEQLLKKD